MQNITLLCWLGCFAGTSILRIWGGFRGPQTCEYDIDHRHHILLDTGFVRSGVSRVASEQDPLKGLVLAKRWLSLNHSMRVVSTVHRTCRETPEGSYLPPRSAHDTCTPSFRCEC
jgi:hypothetical protein